MVKTSSFDPLRKVINKDSSLEELLILPEVDFKITPKDLLLVYEIATAQRKRHPEQGNICRCYDESVETSVILGYSAGCMRRENIPQKELSIFREGIRPLQLHLEQGQPSDDSKAETIRDKYGKQVEEIWKELRCSNLLPQINNILSKSLRQIGAVVKSISKQPFASKEVLDICNPNKPTSIDMNISHYINNSIGSLQAVYGSAVGTTIY